LILIYLIHLNHTMDLMRNMRNRLVRLVSWTQFQILEQLIKNLLGAKMIIAMLPSASMNMDSMFGRRERFFLSRAAPQ
jgi:hypothetical protein